MQKALFTTVLIGMVTTTTLWAQKAQNADFMRSIGKIYVVLAAILAIFIGIVIFLIFLERKLTKLENQIKEND